MCGITSEWTDSVSSSLIVRGEGIISMLAVRNLFLMATAVDRFCSVRDYGSSPFAFLSIEHYGSIHGDAHLNNVALMNSRWHRTCCASKTPPNRGLIYRAMMKKRILAGLIELPKIRSTRPERETVSPSRNFERSPRVTKPRVMNRRDRAYRWSVSATDRRFIVVNREIGQDKQSGFKAERNLRRFPSTCWIIKVARVWEQNFFFSILILLCNIVILNVQIILTI